MGLCLSFFYVFNFNVNSVFIQNDDAVLLYILYYLFWNILICTLLGWGFWCVVYYPYTKGEVLTYGLDLLLARRYGRHLKTWFFQLKHWLEQTSVIFSLRKKIDSLKGKGRGGLKKMCICVTSCRLYLCDRFFFFFFGRFNSVELEPVETSWVWLWLLWLVKKLVTLVFFTVLPTRTIVTHAPNSNARTKLQSHCQV